MARKKRKAGRRPVESSGSVGRPAGLSGGRDAWLLPGLGALALVLSWLAALGGGVADGPMDPLLVFGSDPLSAYGVFRDLFLDDGHSASGWQLGRSIGYFPDFAFQWVLFALGLDLRPALYLFPLLQVGFAAAGWILVCDFLFGKSPARRAAVLLLHAATFLHLAWFDSRLFMLQMVGMWHYGAWACVPWLLWLSMRVLQAPPDGIPPAANLAALAAATAVVVASDLVIAPWLLAPAAAAAALSVRPKIAAALVFALGAGFAAGRALAVAAPVVPNIQPLNFDFARSAFNLRELLHTLGRIADSDRLEFLLLPAFAVALLACLVREFTPDGKKGRSMRGKFCPRRFVLLFMPLSAAFSAAAVGVGGSGVLNDVHPVQDVRYVLPMICFPLFVGWALLPLPAPKFPAEKAALAACAAAGLLALPPAAKIDLAKMDPFGTPFQKCFAENAKRRGWTGAIAPPLYFLQMFLNPDAGLQNYLKVYAPPDLSGFRVSIFRANWRRMSGEFQVVVANAHQGRLFNRPPMQGDRGCPLADSACLRTHASLNGIPPHDAIIRAAFGEPAEIVECAGVGLYHYDPPLRFEFSENPSGQAVGRKL